MRIMLEFEKIKKYLSNPEALICYITVHIAYAFLSTNEIELKKKDFVGIVMGKDISKNYTSRIINGIETLYKDKIIDSYTIEKYSIKLNFTEIADADARYISFDLNTLKKIGSINTKANKCMLVSIYILILMYRNFENKISASNHNLKNKFTIISQETIKNALRFNELSITNGLNILKTQNILYFKKYNAFYKDGKYYPTKIKTITVYCEEVYKNLIDDFMREKMYNKKLPCEIDDCSNTEENIEKISDPLILCQDQDAIPYNDLDWSMDD